jgi:hypothetical protein
VTYGSVVLRNLASAAVMAENTTVATALEHRLGHRNHRGARSGSCKLRNSCHRVSVVVVEKLKVVSKASTVSSMQCALKVVCWCS